MFILLLLTVQLWKGLKLIQRRRKKKVSLAWQYFNMVELAKRNVISDNCLISLTARLRSEHWQIYFTSIWWENKFEHIHLRWTSEHIKPRVVFDYFISVCWFFFLGQIELMHLIGVKMHAFRHKCWYSVVQFLKLNIIFCEDVE